MVFPGVSPLFPPASRTRERFRPNFSNFSIETLIKTEPEREERKERGVVYLPPLPLAVSQYNLARLSCLLHSE